MIVFNPLSWKRTGPVSSAIGFHRGECRPDGLGVVNAGCPAPCQFRLESSYSDGSVREATVNFIAADVPSIGYKTYYLLPTPPGGAADRAIKEGR